MCTILILYQVHPQYPLIIAANRDEYYARAATLPTILQKDPLIVGGQDQEKGGSWMAISKAGRFSGLTNQRTGSMPDKNRKSRGEVVLAALRTPTVEEAKHQMQSLNPKEYNPFNLLFGDAENLYVAYCHDEMNQVSIQQISPGFWVLPNDVIDSKKFNKVQRAKSIVKNHKAPWPELLPSLQNAISDHEIHTPSKDIFVPKGSLLPKLFWKQLEALCIHTPVYGTRSSTIVTATPGKIEQYLFASGASCKTPFVDYTSLLD